ncbi:hypothetical protein [Thalassobacillus sp. CUG 92003]|uniref:hypothetical protein n=1 Tax=Thalassobacillus sp. CUG 92003 TaxID=2736641 RepID=UPI0015E6A01F|nr:hypothetical protein [Thalassobacillus sp. CUG 92003]
MSSYARQRQIRDLEIKAESLRAELRELRHMQAQQESHSHIQTFKNEDKVEFKNIGNPKITIENDQDAFIILVVLFLAFSGTISPAEVPALKAMLQSLS